MKRGDRVGMRMVAGMVSAGLLLSGCVGKTGQTGGGVATSGGGATGNPAGSSGNRAQGAPPSAAVARMDRDDQLRLNQACERLPDNQSVTWSNANTGHYYTVTLRTSLHTAGNPPCRQAEIESVSGGQRDTTVMAACRRPDGFWVFFSNGLPPEGAIGGSVQSTAADPPTQSGKGTVPDGMPADWARQGTGTGMQGSHSTGMEGGWPNMGTMGSGVGPGWTGGPGMSAGGLGGTSTGMGGGWPGGTGTMGPGAGPGWTGGAGMGTGGLGGTPAGIGGGWPNTGTMGPGMGQGGMGPGARGWQGW